jgi:hypothetical protein
MGAWDAGPFENDDALDFLGDLEESSSARSAVARALSSAAETNGYLDASDGSVAVAAAAVIAVVRTGRLAGVADRVRARILQLGLTADDASALAPAAARALDRVDGPESELLDLWDEADSAEEWRATLAPMRDALSA